MTQDSIETLINLTSTWVYDKTGKPLDTFQSEILAQVLAGKKVKDICFDGYTSNTIKTKLTPALWKLLSYTFGQPVNSKTIHRILEKAAQGNLPHSECESTSSTHRCSGTAPFLPSKSSIVHNLPAPTYTKFIGRQQELQKLLKHLSFDRPAHIISIDGTGGVGKTALAMEAAYCCLRGTFVNGDRLRGITFDAIIFVTSKETYLTPTGLVRACSPRRGLCDIFRQIGIVLDLELAGLIFDEQVDVIKQAVSKRLCWLIIDNLESLDSEQQELVLAFLYELPSSVKTVITTRQQIVFVPVRLSSMNKQDSLKLIDHEANEKEVSLSQEDQQAIHQVTGGVPIAICFSIGLLANGYLLDEVLNKLAQPTGEIGRFCFESSVRSLRETPSHLILMTFSLFPTSSIERDILIEIATPNLDVDSARAALAKLRSFSLIQQANQGRYIMLPLMREYSLAELKAYPEIEQELRSRWIRWYIQYSTKYHFFATEPGLGFQDGLLEWPNLQAVTQQCMIEDRYEDLITIWRNTEQFVHIIGRKSTRLGYWDDQLILTDWLICSAQRRGDYSIMAEIMFDRAWMLTLLGKPQQLEEARQLFSQVNSLDHYTSTYLQHELIIRLSVVSIRQGQIMQASLALSKLMNDLSSTELEKVKKTKLMIFIHYYLGRINFQLENYEQAEASFREALSCAQSIKSKKHIFTCRNWLADLAVKRGDTEFAEKILYEDLQVARTNQDKWRMACCLHSLSDLLRSQRNWKESRKYLVEAQELFDSLGMEIEVNEITNLLQSNQEEI